MKGQFEVKGLGTCLVGTYALRNLTKHFACRPIDLLFLSTKEGMDMEFTSYLIKFCYENGLLQQHGAAGLKSKPVEEVDLFIDSSQTINSEYAAMYDALWIGITGMTSEEYIKKNPILETVDIEEDEQKKSSTTGTPTGNTLTKSDSEKDTDLPISGV